MDRLLAIEQSIYAESELSALFNYFATAFYNNPEFMDFWAKMARSEANHAMALTLEKWRVVREEIDSANVKYEEEALIKQMGRFDKLRQEVVMPAEIDQVLDIAIKAEQTALHFHDQRIFLEGFAPSDATLQFIVDGEEFHMEILGKLKSADDKMKALNELDLSSLDEMMSAP